MEPLLTALTEGGPWVVLGFAVAAFLFALARGYLVRGAEIERIERRMEKDTDRVLALYIRQIETLTAAAARKDETIATQTMQIEKLMEHSAVSAHALDSIVKEARDRGFMDAA